MSNLQDIPSGLPINKLNENLGQLDDKLNRMKIDLAEIKSDLKIILQKIKEKQKQEDLKEKDLTKGWHRILR